MKRDDYQRIKKYMESECETKVKAIQFVEGYEFAGRVDGVYSVTIDDPSDPHFWVFYGARPTNFYSKKRFPLSDEAFSFHLGLMARVMDRHE